MSQTGNVISNDTFLGLFGSGDMGPFILPHEVDLAGQKIDALNAEKEEIAAQHREVAEQSGDTWHDGAFRATDEAKKRVDGQIKRLSTSLIATVVEYPTADEMRVTMGSRVRLQQGTAEYDVEIVGVPLLHEADEADDIMPCSIESPIARGIIGQRVGHTAVVTLAERQQSIEVLSIDQETMQRQLSHEVEV